MSATSPDSSGSTRSSPPPEAPAPMRPDAGAGGSSHSPKTPAGGQYFIRHSMNNSIRARRSRSGRSSQRLARRSARRSGRGPRQVRFQPVAQAIEISGSSLDATAATKASEAEAVAAAAQDDKSTGRQRHRQLAARMQQQLNELGRKSRLGLLNGGAKPLTRRLHGQLSKLKVKSLSALANQLGGQRHSHDLAGAPGETLAAAKGFGGGGKAFGSIALRRAWPRKAPAPIQQTFHIRHSAASARHQITLGLADLVRSLEPGHGDGEGPDGEEEEGWGSDFDESESQDESSAKSSLGSTGQAQGLHSQRPNGYLLEIGKSSCDRRAVNDVIQDQGLSGQFKRLELSASPAEEVERELEQPTPEEAGEEEDEAAELASLEARQGYRQVRDKLKLILDRRLAKYERDFEQRERQGAPAQAEGGAQADEVRVLVVEGRACRASANVAVCTSTNTSTGAEDKAVGGAQQEQQQQRPAQRQQQDRFDCQSNCSEASSVSSGGLDSNHSGSQDSGHSTQHSGYSAVLIVRRAATAPGSADEVTAAPSRSPESAGAVSQQLTPSPSEETQEAGGQPEELATTPAAAATINPEARQEAELDPERRERRERFEQNRLLVNHKLESLFKSRSGPALLEGARSLEVSPAKSTQSCPVGSPPHSTSKRYSHAQQAAVGAQAGGQVELEAAVRQRLLEQQRQMSLKLKQKPRRRTAKRALNLFPSGSPVSHSSNSLCAASLDGRSQQADSGGQQLAPAIAQLPEGQEEPAAGSGRGSLTKQLSMVCLRQLSEQQQRRTPSACWLAPSQPADPSDAPRRPAGLLSGGGALSLRQLVKETIDACERPTRVSTLTREVLNRSDSLSSETLAELPAGAKVERPRRPPSEHQQARARSSPDLLADDEFLGPSVEPIGMLPRPSGLSSDQTSTPIQLHSTPSGAEPACQSASSSRHWRPTQHHRQLQHSLYPTTPSPVQAANGASRIYATPGGPFSTDSSSLGTIDGLEYSPSLSADLSQGQPPGRHQLNLKPLQSALRSPGGQPKSPGRVGAYWKSLRKLSRFKMPKVSLAYLENTNNFFSDDELPPMESSYADESNCSTNSNQTAGRWTSGAAAPSTNRPVRCPSPDCDLFEAN